MSLEQVYTVNTSFQVHDRSQTTPLSCDTDLLVRAERAPDRIEVWVRYETVAGKRDDADSDKSVDVWTALVEGVAVFAIDDPGLGVTDAQAEAFAVLVGMPTLHPYAREWTQTLTGQSQYPAFTMGLLESPAEFDPDHRVEFPDRADAGE